MQLPERQIRQLLAAIAEKPQLSGVASLTEVWAKRSRIPAWLHYIDLCMYSISDFYDFQNRLFLSNCAGQRKKNTV